MFYYNISVCKCSDVCDAWVADLVDSIGSKPVELFVAEHELGYHMSVKLEGMPLDIEAICNASACTTEENVVEDLSLKEVDSVWSGSATFSVFVLVTMMGISVVLAICGCAPYIVACCHKQNAEKGSEKYHFPATPVSQDEDEVDATGGRAFEAQRYPS